MEKEAAMAVDMEAKGDLNLIFYLFKILIESQIIFQ